jgi:putative ABC transport system permease protein
VALADNPAAGKPDAEILAVAPSYFDVFGVALRAGRDFSRTDGPDAPRVAIVSETFARERFGTASPLGKRILIGRRPVPFEIVGMVHSVTSSGMRQPATSAVYLSFFQEPNPQLSGGANIALLSDPAVLTPDLIRRHVRAAVPTAAVNVRLFSNLVNASLVNERLMALLATFFGALALSLAAVGLYGLLAFDVSCRTAEIGVRTALGATRRDVVWIVLSKAFGLVGAGLVLGLPLVWATTRLVSGMLFGLTPTDPVAIGGAAALILLIAIAAAGFPVRKALRINPITALKAE